MKPTDDPRFAKLCRNAMVYGVAIHGTRKRKWYNPMRWIKGKYYEAVINPLKMYKKR